MAMRKNKSATPAADGDVLLVLGAGNMGQALVRGLIKAPPGSGSSRPREILLYDTHPAKCEQLLAELATHQDPGTRAIALHMLRDQAELRSALLRATTIALCTKPQDLPAVATGCHGKIKKDALLISVAAGVSLERIATLFKHRGPVVRAMPNIAAKVGAAATGMSANKECGAPEMEKATSIFSAIGEALWIREDLLNAVTGLSGSGPAYIFMVIEALTEGGVKMGIPRDIARQLATQTVYGSAALLKSTGLHPATLREQVTTPGGTTISAIHELEERGLRAMLMSAVATATKRAEELETITTKTN
jgi:pyrroline-5-carboxylate reductase